MKYDPQKHHRRSIRLPHYDYASPGYYFVTICAYDQACILGDVIDEKMMLNDVGRIINYYWMKISRHFPNVKLDEYIVMPNHLHGIIIITVGAKHSSPSTINSEGSNNWNASPLHQRPSGTKSGSLSAIIQNFSSITTQKINRIRKMPSKRLWQRNFYERIIRNENELLKIRDYIINNPLKWESDRNNPDNIKT